ncbi:unnamed protein product [Orchesella dallaii]|uniref:Uncharacterized protein n=1 Tax=Orchesella dallaii TaxID=48710 RepID=A0ABP1RA14_9HEXA
MNEANSLNKEVGITETVELTRAPQPIGTRGHADPEHGLTGERNAGHMPTQSPGRCRCESIISELLKPSPDDTSDQTMDWDDIELSYFGIPENSCNSKASEQNPQETISRLPGAISQQRGEHEVSGSTLLNLLQNEPRSNPGLSLTASRDDDVRDTNGQVGNVSGLNRSLDPTLETCTLVRAPTSMRCNNPTSSGANGDSANNVASTPDVVGTPNLAVGLSTGRSDIEVVDSVDEDER